MVEYLRLLKKSQLGIRLSEYFRDILSEVFT